MGSRRLTLLVALGVLAAACAVGAALLLSGGDEGRRAADTAEQTAPGEAAPDSGTGRANVRPPLPDGIEVHGSLEPATLLFGDTIVARIDVLVDRRRIDPASVTFTTDFLPWEVVGEPSRVRHDSGGTTYLRTTYTLRCLSGTCVPPGPSSPLEFSPAQVSYAGGRPGPDGQELQVDWPTLLVYSRFAAANLESPQGSSALIPWRADLVSFAGVSYRVPPWVLVVALGAVAALLAVAGVVLAVAAVPRRAPAPPPEPEPEPGPVLTPLEQALALLEDASRADGVEDRRRALELVAEVLDEEHPDLARVARALAWSEEDPLVERTSGLAVRVRSAIDENGDGYAQ